MTKALAPSYMVLRATTGLNLSSLNLKVAGMSASYVYSSAHDFHNDLTNIIATSGNLGTKTTTAGVFDSADVSMGSPAGGSTITQFWVYRDSGTSATSELVYYFDEDSTGAAISIATDGTEKTVIVNGSGWFR